MMIRSYIRDRHNIKCEINIIPLLDVLLVLLLIFIATSSSLTQSIEVSLPDASKSQLVSTNDDFPIIIEVSSVGQYSMITKKDRIDNLLPNQVIAEAKQKLHSNSKAVFLIGGAKDVPYNEIVKVLSLLRSADVKLVRLMTNPI